MISTGYGIRCPGGQQHTVEQWENGSRGDSLAVSFGLTYMVRDLEKEGRIRRLEGFVNALVRSDEGYN